MNNRYGLDTDYFIRKMERIIRDMENYKPDEFAREMARMSRTADDKVLLEPEFARDNCQVCLGDRGGILGNENIVNGILVCDYCHAEGHMEDKD